MTIDKVPSAPGTPEAIILPPPDQSGLSSTAGTIAGKATETLKKGTEGTSEAAGSVWEWISSPVTIVSEKINDAVNWFRQDGLGHALFNGDNGYLKSTLPVLPYAGAVTAGVLLAKGGSLLFAAVNSSFVCDKNKYYVKQKFGQPVASNVSKLKAGAYLALGTVTLVATHALKGSETSNVGLWGATAVSSLLTASAIRYMNPIQYKKCSGCY